jgi:L-rhamnonate dehydratase
MAGVDLALWDLKGKALGQPVYRLLGGAYRRELLAYASYMFEPTPEATAAKAAAAVARGFRAVKFGWEPFGQDPAQDEALVKACREAIGPATRLLLDVGFAWETVPTALARCAALDPYDVYWVEEPFWPDDVAVYSRLAGRIRPRLAAGEQECTVAGFRRLMDEGRVDVIQVDLTRVGFTQATVIAELARQRGIEVCNHGFTTGINIAAAAHFLAAIPNALMLEYCAEPGPITEALVPDRPLVQNGYVRVPESPGLGITIDWAVLERYRVDHTPRP